MEFIWTGSRLMAMEDTWFYGEGDADWDNEFAGDQTGDERQQGDFSTANRLLKYADFQCRGCQCYPSITV